MRRTSLFVGLATVASAGMMLFASPATAYPPAGHHLTLSSYAVHQGQSDTAHATGFDQDAAVNAYLHSARVFVGHASTSSTGAATLTFTVPTSLATGTHTFQMVGAQSGESASVTFTVLPAASSASSGGGLPFTGGSDIWPMTFTGIGLVLAGGLALVVVRRRRSHAGVAA